MIFVWAVTWSNAQLWGQSFSGREDPKTTEPGMFEDQKRQGQLEDSECHLKSWDGAECDNPEELPEGISTLF